MTLTTMEPPRQEAGSRCDVLVLGSGIAGSSAAWAAARSGARVVMLEKLDTPGGSAALSAGMFWTAPNFEALRDRIPLGDADLGRQLVADYPAALADIRATGIRVAAEPQHGIMTYGIGYSLDIQALLAHCREQVLAAGGEVVAGARVLRLSHDDGGVSGAVVRYDDGTVTEYRAAAVVLATGGFQGAPDELTRHIGPNADRLVLRSNPGSTGDGLRLARACGAGGTKAMSTFYGHLLPHPLRRFEAEDFLPYSQYYSDYSILVNRQGRRFIDETQGDEILNQALTFQPQARGVLIFDDHVRRTYGTAEPFPGLGLIDRFAVAVEAGGRHASADSLDELVAQVADWGIDRQTLEDTVSGYGAAAQAGGGLAHGVPVAASARAPQTGPFYALEVQPSITFTFGGIRISAAGQVLDPDGVPVPGLFAGGADIGGLSNYGYAGGLAPAFITGRWAGTSAAARAAALSISKEN
ncbi:FAD-dependent oxidoreductase [Arthrobacter sp. I2-34]|uniref:FAD-dependent oxidoreductase n=1 Tax=Arthrobacter hankyongi TaxID=2904801 RepID=A0ABS9L9K8_9MICC|nr:FAD-dependent oxidoreductase [Arthrobacter hankyongi]MCG2623370.1 FAD-dependent oxidoreductase [Arthrobacter hankyongi]